MTVMSSCPFPLQGHAGTHTTTNEDVAATLHHTCILNSFTYLYWVSVEVLTAFVVGMNGVAFKFDHVAVLRSTGLCSVSFQNPASYAN